jgi:hypothetical protein
MMPRTSPVLVTVVRGFTSANASWDEGTKSSVSMTPTPAPGECASPQIAPRASNRCVIMTVLRSMPNSTKSITTPARAPRLVIVRRFLVS